jgi:creatinine amidohydrolase
MTTFFPYEHLTWPEVAALPRNTPLVIPLGNFPDAKLHAYLAEALGQPERTGLLPAIPYGWPGSGLAVPEQILTAFAQNLLDSLADDGFSRVYALTPQDLRLGLGSRQLVFPGLPRVAPPESLPPETERGKVILIPVGHTEQHAYHLPLNTDTLIIQAVSAGTAKAVPDQAYSLPVMPYGVSTHRPAFAGTLNAGGRAFEDFFLALLDNLAMRGFERAYLLSGHGGNCSFLVNVVKYAGERHPQAFYATAWLYLSGPEGIAALESRRQSIHGGMGHACELETSLILHLCPELAHMERVVDEVDFISTPSYSMDWIESGTLVANPSWEDDTRTGAYGAGSLGTSEKGAFWLQAAIAEKVGHVAEIHEQYLRRAARRKEHHR